MAASGLNESTGPMRTDELVIAVAEYAFAIKEQLDDVNENSWNNFKLRIGSSVLSCIVYMALYVNIMTDLLTDYYM